jgi:hypothetical protein
MWSSSLVRRCCAMLVNIVVTAKYGIGTRMFGRCRMGVDVWIEDVKGFVLIKTACVALNEAEFNRNLFISPGPSSPTQNPRLFIHPIPTASSPPCNHIRTSTIKPSQHEAQALPTPHPSNTPASPLLREGPLTSSPEIAPATATFARF